MFDDCLDTLDLLIDIMVNADPVPETAEEILYYATATRPELFNPSG